MTGGAGFIGSNLVDELIRLDNKVIVIDNLSTGFEENLNPKAEFYNKDITDLEDIKPLFKDVDYVFHVAALPNIQFSIDNPVESNNANLNGTLNILVSSKDAGVKKVIYSGSSSTYGFDNELPWVETMYPGPITPYAVQKYVGEIYCRAFSNVYDLPTVCLRYFNIYGPRQKCEGAYAPVMGIFIRKRLAGEPMVIFGDGEQSRDFTYVGDAVRANILAAESVKAKKGEAINVGRGKGITVNEIAKLIGGPVEYKEGRIEVKNSEADNGLARELLGWEPTMEMMDWLKKHIKEVGL